MNEQEQIAFINDLRRLQMAWNKLALRQGEVLSLLVYPPTYNTPNGLTIKVMMVLIDGIPIGDDWNNKCNPYVIVAITEYPEGWGWIELDGDTKYDIGEYMLECNVDVGEWYYLTVSAYDDYKAGAKRGKVAPIETDAAR